MLALLLAGPGGSQDVITQSAEAERRLDALVFEQWQLGSDCRPMDMEVSIARPESFPFDIKNLTQSVVESRLRTAGLYKAGAPEILNVNVSWAGSVVILNVTYDVPMARVRVDTSPPQVGGGDFMIIPIWERTAAAPYRNEIGPLIPSELAAYTDAFINDFLRVNEAACNVRWQQRPNPFRDEKDRRALEDEARRRGLID